VARKKTISKKKPRRLVVRAGTGNLIINFSGTKNTLNIYGLEPKQQIRLKKRLADFAKA